MTKRILVVVVLSLSACAPSAQELELRRLNRNVETMQAQLAHHDDQIERLGNRMTVLADRSRSTPHRNTDDEELSKLEVVRLAPTPKMDEVEEQVSDAPEDQRVWVYTGDGRNPAEALVVVPVPPPPADLVGRSSRENFVVGLQHYRAGEWLLAYNAFQQYVSSHPSAANVAGVYYWMGECLFEAGNYGKAIEQYAKVHEGYPKSSKAADALLKTGIAFERIHDSVGARKAFSDLLTRYPNSAVADLARGRIDARGVAGGSP